MRAPHAFNQEDTGDRQESVRESNRDSSPEEFIASFRCRAPQSPDGGAPPGLPARDSVVQADELTIDSIYSKVPVMNIALTKHFEEMIARMVASGRYNNSSEVVRAGLRILDAEEKSVAAGSFPPGSLRHLYTRTDNRAERRTAKASTLKVEAE